MKSSQVILNGIRAILWPAGAEDKPWSPATLDEIAEVMAEAGLGPQSSESDLQTETTPVSGPDAPASEWLVTWEINLTGNSAQEVAEHALQVMRDPDSIALVFDVYNAHGGCTQIDLLEDD